MKFLFFSFLFLISRCLSGQNQDEIKSNCEKELSSIRNKINQHQDEYKRIKNDLIAGLFCSKCNQSATEFESRGENFFEHVKDVKGEVVSASQEIMDKAHEKYLNKLNSLKAEFENKKKSCQEKLNTAFQNQLKENELKNEEIKKKQDEQKQQKIQAQKRQDELNRQAAENRRIAIENQRQADLAQAKKYEQMANDPSNSSITSALYRSNAQLYEIKANPEKAAEINAKYKEQNRIENEKRMGESAQQVAEGVNNLFSVQSDNAQEKKNNFINGLNFRGADTETDPSIITGLRKENQFSQVENISKPSESDDFTNINPEPENANQDAGTAASIVYYEDNSGEYEVHKQNTDFFSQLASNYAEGIRDHLTGDHHENVPEGVANTHNTFEEVIGMIQSGREYYDYITGNGNTSIEDNPFIEQMGESIEEGMEFGPRIIFNAAREAAVNSADATIGLLNSGVSDAINNILDPDSPGNYDQLNMQYEQAIRDINPLDVSGIRYNIRTYSHDAGQQIKNNAARIGTGIVFGLSVFSGAGIIVSAGVAAAANYGFNH